MNIVNDIETRINAAKLFRQNTKTAPSGIKCAVETADALGISWQVVWNWSRRFGWWAKRYNWQETD